MAGCPILGLALFTRVYAMCRAMPPMQCSAVQHHTFSFMCMIVRVCANQHQPNCSPHAADCLLHGHSGA